MPTITLTHYNSASQVTRQGTLIIDRPFLVGVHRMLWHLDPTEDAKLFDTSGVTYEQNNPHGYGTWITGTLILSLGPENKGVLFATLPYPILYDNKEEEWTFLESGQGWLYRGGSVPSGPIWFNAEK